MSDPTQESPRQKTPPTTSTDTTIDDTPISTPTAQPDVTVVAAYRDIAAFSYTDRVGRQWLSQWIISENGLGYWTRYCSITEKRGPDWANCTTWGHGFEIAELGLAGFGAISGMNTYTYDDASDGEHTQWVAQTVYDDRGTTRMGRICPIEDTRPNWTLCSDWSKLEAQSSAFNISDASAFRDEIMFSYKNDMNEDVLVHTLLSVDGSLTWSRDCQSAGGAPWIGIKQCEFGTQIPVGDYGVKPGVIGGHSAYVYRDVTGTIYAETVLAVSGMSSQRRECPVTERGIDWNGCGGWSVTRLDNLHEYQGPL